MPSYSLTSVTVRVLALLLVWLTTTTARADFGDQSLGWTQEQETAVAGHLQRRLQRQGVVINDIWLEYWLAQRGQRLRQASSASLGPVHVALINDRDFNAFALPGNVMGFNLGLWRTAHTEAEFLSVMAHETAHLSLRHFRRLAQNNQQQAWLTFGGVLLGIALAGVDPDLANAAFAGSQVGALQQNLSFSRSMESEADGLAGELLAKIGYPASAGARVFQRLEQNIAHNPDASDYWQTHPRPTSRVASIDSNEKPKADASTPDHHFKVLRWYVNHSYLPNDDFARKPPETLRLPAPDKEGSWPSELLANAEPNLLYGWLLAQSNLNTGELSQRHLKSLVELFPDFDPAWYQLAAVTARSEGKNSCRRALSHLDEIDETYIQVLELRKRLTAQCQPQREAEVNAQWLWHRGEESRAMGLLRRAIETPESTSQVARLRQLLNHYSNQRALLPQ